MGCLQLFGAAAGTPPLAVLTLFRPSSFAPKDSFDFSAQFNPPSAPSLPPILPLLLLLPSYSSLIVYLCLSFRNHPRRPPPRLPVLHSSAAFLRSASCHLPSAICCCSI